MPKKAPVQVVVVDDHPLFRKGVVEALRGEPDVVVCDEADSVATALTTIDGRKPDVALIDLSLGNESGLDLIATLARTHPNVRVLVLSGHDERVHVDRALRVGALGYVMKDKAASELLTAIRRVASGKSYVSAETAERILSTLGGARPTDTTSLLDRLSNRERRVLTMVGRGLTTREIATALELSIKTVESHYAHIKDKLGIRSGRELIRVAVTWVETDRL